MLRSAGIRTKLLGLVALPMALLLAVSLVVVLQAHQDAALAGRVADVAEASTAVNATVHALQDERAATERALASESAADRATLARTRTATDAAVGVMNAALAPVDLAGLSSDVESSVVLAQNRHRLLPQLRTRIDAEETYSTDALRAYNEAVTADLTIAQTVVGAAGDENVARGVRGITLVSVAIESATRERDLLVRNFNRGGIDNGDYRQLAGHITAQETALADFARIARSSQRSALNNLLAQSGSFALETARSSALDLLIGKAAGDADAAAAAAADRIAPLVALETRVATDAQISAEDVALADRRRELIVLGVAVAGLVVALLLTVLMTRRLVSRVRRLTDAATEIGAELPLMVERMRTPGVAPDLAVEPVSVDSQDELGRLAVAFNAVNATTLRVAQEQADLRAGIAEMFVNVARRNQVLLGRQLAFIDKLEQREENPDQLENLFRLDHLATRMRRNAESLLVLAGLDGSRRLRRPMPLSDVVRTAASEIEQYDRVDLTAQVDPSVSGRVALTLAHLVAELLENATHFSNPDTRVVIATSVEDSGVRLTITDYGLGMTAEEILAANAVISDPPVAEIAVAQRLGFYVVGKLSQRLDASVVLRRGRSSGVIADIVVPTSLFEASTLPRAAAPALHAGDDSLVVRTDLPTPPAIVDAARSAVVDPNRPALVDTDRPAVSDTDRPALVDTDRPADPTPRAGPVALEPAVEAAPTDGRASDAESTPPPSAVAPRSTEARHRARRQGFLGRRRTPATPLPRPAQARPDTPEVPSAHTHVARPPAHLAEPAAAPAVVVPPGIVGPATEVVTPPVQPADPAGSPDEAVPDVAPVTVSAEPGAAEPASVRSDGPVARPDESESPAPVDAAPAAPDRTPVVPPIAAELRRDAASHLSARQPVAAVPATGDDGPVVTVERKVGPTAVVNETVVTVGDRPVDADADPDPAPAASAPAVSRTASTPADGPVRVTPVSGPVPVDQRASAAPPAPDAPTPQPAHVPAVFSPQPDVYAPEPPARAAEPAERSRPQEFPFVPAVDILPTRQAGRRGSPTVTPESPLPAEYTGGAPLPPVRLTPVPAPAPRPASATTSAPAPAPRSAPAPAPRSAPAPAPPPPPAPVEDDGNVTLPRPDGFAAAVAPSAGAGRPPAPTPPAPPQPPVREDARTSLEELAIGARMTSDAFAELSQLSQGYAPRVEAAAAPLVRRQPKAAQGPPASAPTSPSRSRTPDEVRGMLSGFRAGVERARQGSDTPESQN